MTTWIKTSERNPGNSGDYKVKLKSNHSQPVEISEGETHFDGDNWVTAKGVAVLAWLEEVSGKVREEVAEKVGPGFPPKAHRFSSTNQPTAAAKAAGFRKKKFNRDLLRAVLEEPIRIKHDSELAKKLVDLYGPEALTMPSGELMVLRQAEAALASSNTQAFNALSDQAIGRPVQAIANTDSAGEDLPGVRLVAPEGFRLGLMPSNTESDEERKDKSSSSE